MNPVFTGYPTSGPQATPEQYDLAKPVYFDADPMLVEGCQRRCPYITPYPPNFRRLEVREFPPKARTEVRSEDIDALVPGMIYFVFDFSMQHWHIIMQCSCQKVISGQLQCSPFMTLYMGSIGMDCIISKL